MCDFIVAPITALVSAFGSGATAAGATAAATTTSAITGGSLLQTVGSALAIGGSLAQGVAEYRAGKENVRLINEQRATERALASTQDQRARLRFNSAIRRQAAELAQRGISLDSPTAVLLGQTAAQEMSFESQAIRSGGVARDRELGAEAAVARSRGTTGLLRGVTSAAGSFLDRAPDLWPELMT
jgi:hypothetical protein